MTIKTYPLRRTPEVGDYFRNAPDAPLMRRLANSGALWKFLNVDTLEIVGPSTEVVESPFICDDFGQLLQTDRPFADTPYFCSAPHGYRVWDVPDDDGLRELHAAIGLYLQELER